MRALTRLRAHLPVTRAYLAREKAREADEAFQSRQGIAEYFAAQTLAGLNDSLLAQAEASAFEFGDRANDGADDLPDGLRVTLAAECSDFCAELGTDGHSGFERKHDSPSVGGPETSTVGAPGAVAPVTAPGNLLAWHGPEVLSAGYRLHLVRPGQSEARAACGRTSPIGGWRIHDLVSVDRNPFCRACQGGAS